MTTSGSFSSRGTVLPRRIRERQTSGVVSCPSNAQAGGRRESTSITNNGVPSPESRLGSTTLPRKMQTTRMHGTPWDTRAD
jgi:hypothetical protein